MLSLVWLLLCHHRAGASPLPHRPFSTTRSSSSMAFLWPHTPLSNSRRHPPHHPSTTLCPQQQQQAPRRRSSSSTHHAATERDSLDTNTGTFGDHVPFASLGLSPWLTTALEAAGKPVSTHIQALSLPPILAGEDVIIGSETGAGKTLAYLIPLLDLARRAAPARAEEKAREMEYYLERKAAAKLDAGSGGDNRLSSLAEDFPWEAPFALVLVPNRQLSDQVLRMAKDVLSSCGDGAGIPKVDALVGAVEEWPYHPKTRPAPDVLVCTPATLSYFDRDIGLFSRVATLVVDEADMLLEGDYGRHLDRILVAFKRADRLHATRTERPTQYVLSAATLPTYGLKSVEELVKKRFPTATRVNTDLMHRHHPKLTQAFIEAPEALPAKIEMLLRLLEKLQAKATAASGPLPKTMIFVNTAQAATRVQDSLAQAGFPSVPFHKEVKAASEREDNLRQFRENEVPLLVCTDLASRGLDIPDVKQVIQVEFAPNVVQHLHRIGRAVRAGREGRAVNFYDVGSEDLVESLQLAGEESLDRSFSRQRGFRKKIKKYGKDYYRKPEGGYLEGRERERGVGRAGERRREQGEDGGSRREEEW